ncbi:MAG TPA: PaeR7I family type II restriction endonuclease [Mycobacteriales bacterium]|nr:PaeR7I family type II restriction endonuclease [Mycobacteriales bacterium]
MTVELPSQRVQHAMESFWFTRDEQTSRLDDGGAAGGAARANGHMGEVARLVADLFLDAGIAPADIRTGQPYLPGYYRVRKQWDLVVTHHGYLVAAVEFKSQVGSVGKNYNNRFEEALGSATDALTAQRKFQPYGVVPPWLAYVFVLQESAETEAPRRASAIFPPDPEFSGLSYNQRYQMMLTRFLGDHIYHACWFVTTRRNADTSVTFEEPLPIATGRSFAAAVEGRVNYVRTVAAQE